jgi:hypothetical protein
MKPILIVASFFFFICAQSQTNSPKIEAYVAPGFFFEQLSKDSLVPPDRRDHDRLGDVVSYAIQAAIPLKNERWTIKAGVGFSQRHYSLNKYDIGDVFIILFSFGFQLPRDSFNLRYVRFTNNYFQVPVSFSYTVTKPEHNFQLAFGLNFRSDFLTQSKAEIIFDSTYKVPTRADIIHAKTIYTHNASKFVFTAESYMEGSFSVHKNLGLLFQFRPFSFYSGGLDKRLTTSTMEVFSFTFGAFYSLK